MTFPYFYIVDFEQVFFHWVDLFNKATQKHPVCIANFVASINVMKISRCKFM